MFYLSPITNLQVEQVRDQNLSKHVKLVNCKGAKGACRNRARVTWEGARAGLGNMIGQADAKPACAEATWEIAGLGAGGLVLVKPRLS